ncbi:hypothetical protein K474DRAFT_1773083 [Panus rudis PR-1116 ss-1]|nr:hypothetical protein K474DRAFT_1773083 [Panus rudis PR-1116 ss-1]
MRYSSTSELANWDGGQKDLENPTDLDEGGTANSNSSSRPNSDAAQLAQQEDIQSRVAQIGNMNDASSSLRDMTSSPHRTPEITRALGDQDADREGQNELVGSSVMGSDRDEEEDNCVSSMLMQPPSSPSSHNDIMDMEDGDTDRKSSCTPLGNERAAGLTSSEVDMFQYADRDFQDSMVGMDMSSAVSLHDIMARLTPPGSRMGHLQDEDAGAFDEKSLSSSLKPDLTPGETSDSYPDVNLPPISTSSSAPSASLLMQASSPNNSAHSDYTISERPEDILSLHPVMPEQSLSSVAGRSITSVSSSPVAARPYSPKPSFYVNHSSPSNAEDHISRPRPYPAQPTSSTFNGAASSTELNGSSTVPSPLSPIPDTSLPPAAPTLGQDIPLGGERDVKRKGDVQSVAPEPAREQHVENTPSSSRNVADITMSSYMDAARSPTQGTVRSGNSDTQSPSPKKRITIASNRMSAVTGITHSPSSNISLGVVPLHGTDASSGISLENALNASMRANASSVGHMGERLVVAGPKVLSNPVRVEDRDSTIITKSTATTSSSVTSSTLVEEPHRETEKESTLEKTVTVAAGVISTSVSDVPSRVETPQLLGVSDVNRGDVTMGNATATSVDATHTHPTPSPSAPGQSRERPVPLTLSTSWTARQNSSNSIVADIETTVIPETPQLSRDASAASALQPTSVEVVPSISDQELGTPSETPNPAQFHPDPPEEITRPAKRRKVQPQRPYIIIPAPPASFVRDEYQGDVSEILNAIVRPFTPPSPLTPQTSPVSSAKRARSTKSPEVSKKKQKQKKRKLSEAGMATTTMTPGSGPSRPKKSRVQQQQPPPAEQSFSPEVEIVEPPVSEQERERDEMEICLTLEEGQIGLDPLDEFTEPTTIDVQEHHYFAEDYHAETWFGFTSVALRHVMGRLDVAVPRLPVRLGPFLGGAGEGVASGSGSDVHGWPSESGVEHTSYIPIVERVPVAVRPIVAATPKKKKHGHEQFHASTKSDRSKGKSKEKAKAKTKGKGKEKEDSSHPDVRAFTPGSLSDHSRPPALIPESELRRYTPVSFSNSPRRSAEPTIPHPSIAPYTPTSMPQMPPPPPPPIYQPHTMSGSATHPHPPSSHFVSAQVPSIPPPPPPLVYQQQTLQAPIQQPIPARPPVMTDAFLSAVQSYAQAHSPAAKLGEPDPTSSDASISSGLLLTPASLTPEVSLHTQSNGSGGGDPALAQPQDSLGYFGSHEDVHIPPPQVDHVQLEMDKESALSTSVPNLDDRPPMAYPTHPRIMHVHTPGMNLPHVHPNRSTNSGGFLGTHPPTDVFAAYPPHDMDPVSGPSSSPSSFGANGIGTIDPAALGGAFHSAGSSSSRSSSSSTSSRDSSPSEEQHATSNAPDEQTAHVNAPADLPTELEKGNGKGKGKAHSEADPNALASHLPTLTAYDGRDKRIRKMSSRAREALAAADIDPEGFTNAVMDDSTMGTESATNVSIGPRPGKPKRGANVDKSLSTCHHCRRRTAHAKMDCSNVVDGEKCQMRFCVICISKRYPDVQFDAASTTFICPRCKNACNCSLCCAKRGEDYVRERAPRKKTSDTPATRKGTRLTSTPSEKPPKKSTAPASIAPITLPPGDRWGTVYGVDGRPIGTGLVKDNQHIVLHNNIEAGPPPAGQVKPRRRVFIGQWQSHWETSPKGTSGASAPDVQGRAYIGRKEALADRSYKSLNEHYTDIPQDEPNVRESSPLTPLAGEHDSDPATIPAGVELGFLVANVLQAVESNPNKTPTPAPA